MNKKKNTTKKVVPVITTSPVEQMSIKFTHSIGTPYSVVIHTIFFIGIFALKGFGYSTEEILLILTTAVSLEAIYLAIFIQMTINRQEAKLHEVREEIEEISEDIEDIQEDVEDIQEDVEELGEDFDEITEDISEIQEDVSELGEDLEEITEDMEEDDKKEAEYRSERNRNLQQMEQSLQSIIAELEKMKENDNVKK